MIRGRIVIEGKEGEEALQQAKAKVVVVLVGEVGRDL
jgi:5S rRNA maturation endonuclease (ribonuclease M5)